MYSVIESNAIAVLKYPERVSKVLLAARNHSTDQNAVWE